MGQIDRDLKNINSQFLSKKTSQTNRGDLINEKYYNLSSVKRNGTSSFTMRGDEDIPDNPDDQPEGLSFKKFCAVFSADVGGAWAGTWAGGKVGLAVGSFLPGAGTATAASVFAVSGAVVVGAAASYGASDAVPDSTLALIEYQNEPTEGEESASDGHNRLLNSMIFSSSPTSLFGDSPLTSNESIIADSCAALISSTLNAFSGVEPSVSLSKSYVLGIVTDSFITTISNNFFDGLEYLTTPQDVSDFIDSYVSYVNNTTNLDQTQKATVIAALEASKGSLSYWSPLIVE